MLMCPLPLPISCDQAGCCGFHRHLSSSSPIYYYYYYYYYYYRHPSFLVSPRIGNSSTPTTSYRLPLTFNLIVMMRFHAVANVWAPWFYRHVMAVVQCFINPLHHPPGRSSFRVNGVTGPSSQLTSASSLGNGRRMAGFDQGNRQRPRRPLALLSMMEDPNDMMILPASIKLEVVSATAGQFEPRLDSGALVSSAMPSLYIMPYYLLHS